MHKLNKLSFQFEVNVVDYINKNIYKAKDNKIWYNFFKEVMIWQNIMNQ